MRRVGAVLVGALLASGACRVEHVPNPGDDAAAVRRAAILAMLEGSADAWNRGELEGFLDDYLDSPRTTYVGRGGLRTGFESIRERYAPLFAPGAPRDSLRFEDLSVRGLGSGYALATARWILYRDGSVTGSGPFTLVLRRVGGEWKIIHDHSSSDPTPD
ncbi:MAG: YybH family protein [Gemmatimonadota bacterium]